MHTGDAGPLREALCWPHSSCHRLHTACENPCSSFWSPGELQKILQSPGEVWQSTANLSSLGPTQPPSMHWALSMYQTSLYMDYLVSYSDLSKEINTVLGLISLLGKQVQRCNLPKTTELVGGGPVFEHRTESKTQAFIQNITCLSPCWACCPKAERGRTLTSCLWGWVAGSGPVLVSTGLLITAFVDKTEWKPKKKKKSTKWSLWEKNFQGNWIWLWI